MKLPVLHLVATDGTVERRSFAPVAREILAAAGPRVAVHLRLKRASARMLYELASVLGSAANEAGAWCVVNGRADVALCAGSRAVQLGFGALPIPAVRSLCGDAIAIGASVHSEGEARKRVREGADYLIAGSVFETPTHPEARPGGLGLVSSCAGAGAPVIGIGGIGPENAGAVVRAGAAGIAVVRAVWDATDPVAAAIGLLEVLPDPDGSTRTFVSRRDDGRPAGGRD